MLFKALGSYGWTLVTGISTAIVAGGGYGVFNYFGKDSPINGFLTDWHEEKKVNENITFAEYINKEYSGVRRGSCKRWKNGVFGGVNQRECDQMIQKYLDKDFEKQPEVWFRANKASIEEALLDHFSGTQEVERSKFFQETWEISQLTCEKKVSSDKDLVEVSCHFKEESTPRRTN
ncbi:hypothetical protein [Mycoplasma suis]|uniref:Uncharacterized protein n=1 Tax=Mycoplasma suis (strain Illinois) TaxID=768700 RepID=F0QQJ2_MYCSL|nr:hypothetical protein [Mycoplasma suis]ADX97762.1 hypothetical protein MSU_0218 [Mycoplasma suis str. Illinois]